jgi:hypothetical protein
LSEANKSLKMYETEIKQERQQARIEKYRYGIYGIIIGLAIGGFQ